MLNVPCVRKGQFLNQRISYLKFKVANTSVITEAEVTAGKQATITPDYSISSLLLDLRYITATTFLSRSTSMDFFTQRG